LDRCTIFQPQLNAARPQVNDRILPAPLTQLIGVKAERLAYALNVMELNLIVGRLQAKYDLAAE